MSDVTGQRLQVTVYYANPIAIPKTKTITVDPAGHGSTVIEGIELTIEAIESAGAIEWTVTAGDSTEFSDYWNGKGWFCDLNVDGNIIRIGEIGAPGPETLHQTDAVAISIALMIGLQIWSILIRSYRRRSLDA